MQILAEKHRYSSQYRFVEVPGADGPKHRTSSTGRPISPRCRQGCSRGQLLVGEASLAVSVLATAKKSDGPLIVSKARGLADARGIIEFGASWSGNVVKERLEIMPWVPASSWWSAPNCDRPDR
ncbi:hypothetical protein EVG20_g10545 [Dentipellis fragilis]|uniref:Uncharacterized protein n=1 Tax=Dentipellis fragilis TaxID=205917 RepID=A0A4Y9XRQ6_9AGAM|nr:hypothetical protein EVG20_g10545 [Dentipellis fragilis]